LEALQQGRVKEVRIITSKVSDKSKEFEAQGAKVVQVDFERKDSLVNGLRNVDVVICAMGTGPGSVQSRRLLLEAMAMTGVDVYFPTEWGTNHYSPRMAGLDHAVFVEKKAHWKEAGLKPGLKRIRFHCSMIMECTFGAWDGLDCKLGVWKIPGNGETPVGMTASRDIGRFAVEAALLALSEPDRVPEALEVVGDIATLKECAEMLDAVSGKKTRLQCRSYQDALTKQTNSRDFLSIFPLLFQVGALSLRPEEANGNALLNPGESLWKIKKLKEFAEETGGIP
jgi:replicative DNA helicase